MEFVDTFDAHGRRLGKMSRDQVHRSGTWHRAAHCWVHRATESGVEILFQRRGYGKVNHPGVLDASVGGHLSVGEGIDGLIREIREEIGLHVAAEALRACGSRVVDERIASDYLNREVQSVYCVPLLVEMGQPRPIAPEVAGLVWLSCALVAALDCGDLERIVAQEQLPDQRISQVVLNRASFASLPYAAAACANIEALGSGSTPAQLLLADGSRWDLLGDPTSALRTRSTGQASGQ